MLNNIIDISTESNHNYAFQTARWLLQTLTGHCFRTFFVMILPLSFILIK